MIPSVKTWSHRLSDAAGPRIWALPDRVGGRAAFFILCGLIVLWLGWIVHIRDGRTAELADKRLRLGIMAAAVLGGNGDAIPPGIRYGIWDSRGIWRSGNLTPPERLAMEDSNGQRDGILIERYSREGRTAVATMEQSGALADWRADGEEEVAALLAITALAVGLSVLFATLRASRLVTAKARAEAEAANEAKGTFIATMSHELRTPLNAVSGFAQLLREDPRLPLECRQSAERIADGAAQAVSLLADILDFAKIDAGCLSVAAQAVAVAPLVESVLGMLQTQAETAGITLQVETAAVRIGVRADPLRLRQVLLNLVSNAIKYNRPAGWVRVEAGLAPGDAGWVRIAVHDCGIGVPPERQSELFQPFRRLGAESTGIEGSGLGLNISRQLVTLMGGRIGWDSVPGQGSRFWLELPAAEPEVAPAEPRAVLLSMGPRPSSASMPLRVLYLEDNPLNAAVMKQFVAAMPGCALATATTGIEGVALAQAHRPDLILADLRLPDIDGYEVLRRLRAAPETAAIPVIAVTADAAAEDVARTQHAGFAGHLAKPVELAALRAVLDRHAGLGQDNTTSPGPAAALA